MKRIGVIGSINRDTITHANGARTESYGGILYTAVALAHMGGDEVEAWLLCEYGHDVGEEVRGLLAACPKLRTDGAREVPRPNPHSRIRYLPDASKEERLSGDIRPLTWEALAPYVPALDGVVLNFITGFEVDLETLRRLRDGLRGPILMDVHSLTLGRRVGGERYWRRPDDWEAWIAQADVVQMNDAEATLLGDLQPPGTRANVSRDRLQSFALELVGMGPGGAAITLGPAGAVGAHRCGDQTELWERAAEAPELAIDPTGCGDVFLAGLGAGIFSGRDLPAAADLASRAAGLSSRLRGVEALGRLAEVTPV